jgi:hypothetical protein
MEASRSLEEALVDLLAVQQRFPDPKRIRIIEMIRAEIQHRELVQASRRHRAGRGYW